MKLTIIVCSLWFFSLPVFAYDVAFLAIGEQGYWQVWLLDSSTQKTKQISATAYDKNRVSWHRDGRRLLVNGQQGELVWLDSMTRREVAIELPVTGFNDAVLSPDSEMVTFSLSTSESKNDNNIWTYHLATKTLSKLSKLTNLPNLQFQPAWGDGGNSIYFLSGRGKETLDIWRVEIKSGNKQQLTFDNLYHFDIDVSDTGSQLFSGNQSGDSYNIWLRQNDKAPQQLTDHASLDASPSWSPDGKSLLFYSTRSGAANIWQFHLQSEQLTQLTQYTGAGAIRPVWYRGESR